MENNVVPIRVGSGIEGVRGTPPNPVEQPQEVTPVPSAEEDQIAALRRELREQFDAAVADVEFRLRQQYELMSRAETGKIDRVYVEDIVDKTHRLTGYTVTANSPAQGSIAWASLHVVFMGVDYTIANGNTANKYVWFIKPSSGTTATLQSGNTLPTLGPNDALIFVNNNGVPTSVLESSMAAAVMPGSVTQQSLASDVATVLSNIQDDLSYVQNQVDGAIVSYFQNDPPWPNGSPSPDGGDTNQGDIWYDANDGGAFRWSGATGSPANTWVRIADTDTSEIAAKVNTKVTTYVGTTAPTAPPGGHTNGDIWIDTSAGNVTKRWNGSWQTLQVGDGAISGVGAGKVSGVLGTGNIPTLDIGTKTSGNLTGSRVGSGINGANITGGTVGNTQLGTNAVQPKNINAAFHLLY